MSNPSLTQDAIRRTSPLTAVFKAMGARFDGDDDWETAACFTAPTEEAWAVRQSVGLCDVSRIPKFDIRGNHLGPLPELRADARVWRPRNRQLLVTCGVESGDVVRYRLNQYAEAARESVPVYVTDVTPVYAALLLAGPRCKAVLRKLVDLDVSDAALPNLSCAQSGVHHVHVLVARQDLPDCRAYLILSGREYGEWLWETVMHAGHEFSIEAFGSRAQKILGAG